MVPPVLDLSYGPPKRNKSTVVEVDLGYGPLKRKGASNLKAEFTPSEALQQEAKLKPSTYMTAVVESRRREEITPWVRRPRSPSPRGAAKVWAASKNRLELWDAWNKTEGWGDLGELFKKDKKVKLFSPGKKRRNRLHQARAKAAAAKNESETPPSTQQACVGLMGAQAKRILARKFWEAKKRAMSSERQQLQDQKHEHLEREHLHNAELDMVALERAAIKEAGNFREHQYMYKEEMESLTLELVIRAWARVGSVEQLCECSQVEALALIEPAKFTLTSPDEFVPWQRRQEQRSQRKEQEFMSKAEAESLALVVRMASTSARAGI